MQNDTEGTTGQTATRKRRMKMAGSGLFILLLGVLPLLNSLDNPRVATLRVPDVIRLIAVGWCFGIGATLLATGLTSRRE